VRGASEEAVAGPVLPDRLKHQHVKGPDHPTPFAKGTTDHDDTAGGMYFGGAAAVSSEAEGAVEGGVEGASAEFAAGPQGWTAARINVDLHVPPELDQYASSHTAGLDSNFYDSAAPLRPLEGGTFATKRVFSETDFQLEFIAKEEFGGRKEGFVFRLGAQGLGYYRDTYKRPCQDHNDSIAQEQQDSQNS
jgi:hypothetical protein